MPLDTKFFDTLAGIVGEMDNPSFKEILLSQKEKYLSPEVRVGMWGQVSCGKSSFINALLGENLLPTNIGETTAMVTEIKHGDERQMVIHAGGETRSYPYSQELAICCLTGKTRYDSLPPSVRKSCDPDTYAATAKQVRDVMGDISKVEVMFPSEVLKGGTIFVDLPGLDGNSQNGDLTESEVTKCEIILWLQSPDRYLDEYHIKNINRLRELNKKTVTFAIQTKLDLKLKNYSKKMVDEQACRETYRMLLDEFKADLKDQRFDSYFLISPSAYLTFLQTGGSEEETFDFLKTQHRNKFRFLREEHPIRIVSGYEYFSSEFMNSIQEFKDLAKEKVFETEIEGLIKRIEEDLSYKYAMLQRKKQMKAEEYNDHKNKLKNIKDKIAKIKDITGRVENIGEARIRSFLNQNYEGYVNEGLSKVSLDKEKYASKEEFNKEIEKKICSAIEDGMKDKKCTQLLEAILEEVFSDFEKDAIEIQELIKELSLEVLGEGHSNWDKVSAIEEGLVARSVLKQSGVNIDQNVLAGTIVAVVATIAMDVVLEAVLGGFIGGFGIFMVGRAAWKGANQSSWGVAGKALTNSVLDMWNTASRKWDDLAEVKMILRRLEDPKEREEIAKNIYKESYEAFSEKLSEQIKSSIVNKLKETNIIETLEAQCEGRERDIEEQYNLSKKQLANREREIKEMVQLRKKFEHLLIEYGLVSERWNQQDEKGAA